MAKEKKAAETPELIEETPVEAPVKKKKKKGIKLIIFFILLVIIGVAGFLFRKPIGNFLSPKLQKVPVVGKFLNQSTDPYSKVSKEQLITEAKTNKTETEKLNKTITDLQAQNKTLEDKISTLKQYETKYADFLSQKKAWDEKIAQSNPDLFVQQFEKMYPDMMQQIYKDIKTKEALTKEQKQFSSTIAQMEQDQAAKALETLLPTDPELVKLILDGMEQERKSVIMNSMTSQNAATVIKLLSPSVAAAN